MKGEQNIRDTAGEEMTNWEATFSTRLLHMDIPVLADR